MSQHQPPLETDTDMDMDTQTDSNIGVTSTDNTDTSIDVSTDVTSAVEGDVVEMEVETKEEENDDNNNNNNNISKNGGGINDDGEGNNDGSDDSNQNSSLDYHTSSTDTTNTDASTDTDTTTTTTTTDTTTASIIPNDSSDNNSNGNDDTDGGNDKHEDDGETDTAPLTTDNANEITMPIGQDMIEDDNNDRNDHNDCNIDKDKDDNHIDNDNHANDLQPQPIDQEQLSLPSSEETLAPAPVQASVSVVSSNPSLLDTALQMEQQIIQTQVQVQVQEQVQEQHDVQVSEQVQQEVQDNTNAVITSSTIEPAHDNHNNAKGKVQQDDSTEIQTRVLKLDHHPQTGSEIATPATPKVSTPVPATATATATATVQIPAPVPVLPPAVTKAKSSNQPDNDEQIAAQMAAVAVAANTASSGSPAAAAKYARNISATIAALPPSPGINATANVNVNSNVNTHANVNVNDKKKKKNDRVKVVQEELLLTILKQSVLTTGANSSANANASTSDQQAGTKGIATARAEGEEIEFHDDKNHIQNAMMQSNANANFNANDSTAADPDDNDNDNDNEKDNENEDPSTASIMLQHIANGQNTHLLKHLLLVNHIQMIEVEAGGAQSIGYSSEQQQDAEKAAEMVLQTITQVEVSYNHLIDCIGARSRTQMLAPTLNDDLSIGSANTADGLEDYDPNSSFTNHSFDSNSCGKVIPDLLPLCTSAEGDATNAFFRACAAVQVMEGGGDGAAVGDDAREGSGSRTSRNDIDSKVKVGTGAGVGDLDRTSSAIAKAVSKTGMTFSTAAGDTLSNMLTRTDGPSQSSSRNLASTIMGSMFSTVNRRRNKKRSDNDSAATVSSAATANSITTSNQQNMDNSVNAQHQESHVKIGEDYNVTIAREMLGLTVENVLERTVVRTVLPNGAAKRAGTKVGSLVVKVGTVETANLTHFETIDELRQSQRPLKLVLRRIGKDSLRGAREEMGRLIKGGGFGTLPPRVPRDREAAKDSMGGGSTLDITDEEVCYEDMYLKILNKQWMEATKKNLQANSAVITKKDEALSKVGAKLAWILSVLVAGFEREVSKKKSGEGKDFSFLSDHTIKDYADTGRSVSKILHDYMQKHFHKLDQRNKVGGNTNDAANSMNVKRKKQVAPPPHIQDRQRQAVPGASKRSLQKGGNNSPQSHCHAEDALLLIGDVLHRARSFLSDPNSTPAALLRGELIALLCDILDLDNDMTLSEEESESSSAGGNAGLINDLGSAGSLLKLIVLNCSMMRSPGCHNSQDHAAHAGNRFLAVVHRLAASRSTSARVTACSLGPVLWSHLDFPHQLQLRGVITRALHDVEVIVRKSTATVLHEIAELVFDPRAVPWLVLMCERAMTDPEPQLRAAAMTLTYHLAEHLPNAFMGDASEGSRSIRGMPSRSDPMFAEVYLLQCKLLPVATRLAEDNTGSVRLAVAAQCDRLAGALGEHWHSVLIDLLQALLGDKDDRVRGEATLCIPRLIESVLSGASNIGDKNVFILDALLPVALKLQKDPVADVRMCLAAASGELLSFLVWLHSSDESATNEDSTKEEPTQKRYIDGILIPLLQALLQDADPEVTSAALRAVTNASRIHARDAATRRNEDDSVSLSSQSHAIDRVDPVFRPVLSEAQVLRLVPTLSDLSSSAQWRVRQSAVEIVPALLGCTHNMETRSEIAELCVKLMSDNVDAVRKSAAECLCLGGSNLGSDESGEADEWLSIVVMPHLEACCDSADSKQRLLSLKMAEMILADNGRWNSSMIEEINSESGKVGAVSLSRRCLEVASKLSSDNIVNVRLNVGRMYGNVLNSLSSDDDLDFIISTLESQLECERSKDKGGDRDVIYFAKKAMAQAKERMNRLDEISSLR